MTGLPPARQLLLALYEATGDAVMFTSAAGTIVEHSPAALAKLGREALIGVELGSLVTDARALASARELLARAGEASTTLHARRGDGSTFAAALTGARVPETELACWVIRDVDERAERALTKLRDTNELLRALSDAAFEAVFMHSQGRIRMANRAAEIYSGVGPGELVGRELVDFIAPQSMDMALAKVATNSEEPYEAFGLRSDGVIYPVEVHARTTPVDLGSGPLRVVAMRDMTVRRALEERLRQSQKLEAIGRFAASVAHDFNNLLAVMIGATELARDVFGEELALDHPGRADLDAVLDAAHRASRLIDQLLAFGRKTQLRPEIVDATALLGGMRPMLQRLVGDAGELALTLPERPTTLRVDPTQLEQVVVNLVVNASDAIARQRGRVHVSLEAVTLDETLARDAGDLAPGPHVKITVQDDGVGMDEETRQRLFEPFFTTKEAGAGTGLGLASVFGIITQSGGAIQVESEPGRGATFRVYLPSASLAA